jgi:hypothetical protein
MLIRCLIFLLFLNTLNASAQEWFKGAVVLANENVVSGELTYRPGGDALFLRVGEKEPMMVIPAFRVKSFSFREDGADTERKFVTFRNTHGAATSYQFYEIVAAGTITLLRSQQNLWYSFRTETLEFDYFVLIDGKMMSLKTFRWHVYPSLKKSSALVRDFVRKNKINIFNVDDTLLFIRYFNFEQPVLARAQR